jgi:lipopolysaccharide biosynthesis protein
LIEEIINKTNNIPIKFDLFISSNFLTKKNYLYNFIKKNTKANQFEIEILENKRRDFMPLLIQMKNKIKKYKYICYIHTKKSIYLNVEETWRNYLLNNLLGNKDIIFEILTDFENNDKLGFVFPENY